MANVSFEEPAYQPAARPEEQKLSVLSRLVISWGLAKDGTSAQRVLLIIALLALGAAGALFALDAYRVEKAQAPAVPTNIPGQF